MARGKRKQAAQPKKRQAPAKPTARKPAAPKVRAQKTASSGSRLREAVSSRAEDALARVFNQAKEPLSLIETLKEEGVARAAYLVGFAANMAGSVTKAGVKSQVSDLAKTFGFVTKPELEKLRARIESLEDRFIRIESAIKPGGPTEGDSLEEFESLDGSEE